MNIGTPLNWFPDESVEGFEYKLSEQDKSALGFFAEFTVSPPRELLRRKHAKGLFIGRSFGLEAAVEKGGVSLIDRATYPGPCIMQCIPDAIPEDRP